MYAAADIFQILGMDLIALEQISLLNIDMVKEFQADPNENVSADLELFLRAEKIDFIKEPSFWKTSDFDDHPPQFEILPNCVNQLTSLVRWLNEFSIPFHVVSRGQNFGYGDKNLNESLKILINLSKMNRILSFNENLGTIEIEPGVSQSELSHFLKEVCKSKKWILDVTGANLNASVVGNFLERGFGHSSFGDHELYGKIIEGLTVSGEIIYPHQSMYESSLTRGLYQHDSALNFEKIFYQTNFLIVTKYLLRLRPVPEKTEMAVVLFKDDETAARGLEIVSELKMRGDIISVPHMANSKRVKISTTEGVSPIEKWALTIDISGSREIVRARRQVIKKYFRGSKIHYFNRIKLHLIDKLLRYVPGFKFEKDQFRNLKQLFQVYSGTPEDGFYVSSFLKNSNELRRANWICPLLPSTQNDFFKVRDILKAQLGPDFLELPITISVVSDRCAVWISEISSDEGQQAKNRFMRLKVELEKNGYLYYRHGLNYSKYKTDLDINAQFFKNLYSLIKKYFDPQSLMSRGRWE